MRHNKEAPTVLTETRLWINLVGDAKGFEGETTRDRQILVDLVGKSSFAWKEENELVKEADKHNYGVTFIVFDKAEWKENYQGQRSNEGDNRRIKVKARKKTNQLRRKAA